MHTRTYVPMLGRFTSPDVKRSFSLLNPGEMNRYAYGLNSPAAHVDPDGTNPIKTIIWNGFRAGWGWAEHVVLRHVRRDLNPSKSKFISEAVGRRATESNILNPQRVARQADGLLLKQSASSAAVGTEGQMITRSVVYEVEPGVEALVTSLPAKTFKNLALALGIADALLSPWDSAEAAGPSSTMVPRGTTDPRFAPFERADSSTGTNDAANGGDGVGIPKVVRVCNGTDNCHLEMRP